MTEADEGDANPAKVGFRQVFVSVVDAAGDGGRRGRNGEGEVAGGRELHRSEPMAALGGDGSSEGG